VLFWSEIWCGKLSFLKIIFKENCIYLRYVIWIYIYSGTPIIRLPTGGHSIGRVNGAGVVAYTLAFLKVSSIIAITSFLNFFPGLKFI